MRKEHPFDRAARDLDAFGTAAIGLAHDVDIVLTVTTEQDGAQSLKAALVTGEYHKTTLKLSSAVIRPPEADSWGPGVNQTVRAIWEELDSSINFFKIAQAALAPAFKKHR